MDHCFYQESKLLDRAGAGDVRAFDCLFALHCDRIRAGLWHLLGEDQELVEETVGIVFLRAFLALPRFRRQAAFSTWLFRIAVREAQTHRRTLAREYQQRVSGSERQKELPVANEDPEQQYLKAEENRWLRQAVNALPEPYRTPVFLRYIETLTAVEIARRLERPEGTVRYQISYGLKILRERFFC
jgi:RNA polymerase sigma-70 factor (ECF subfamily)